MILLWLLLAATLGQEPAAPEDIVDTGCYETHKDCSDEVLICSARLNDQQKEVEFNALKECIYQRVGLGQTNKCCDTFVKEGQQDDPDWIADQQYTPAPTKEEDKIVTKNGDPKECSKQRSSSKCREWGPCRWEYWTRVCKPVKFDNSVCLEDNRDCKDELHICIERERAQGRAPNIRNLEPCVIMNEQSDCCELFTNNKLSLGGPKRPNRPDRYDLENCELFRRNTACKNQAHCKWSKTDKSCYPMRGIRASGLWYVPEMSCGYKGFKLFFKEKISVTKRNVSTVCDCALYCEEYKHWTWRQATNKCGCTDSPIRKVAREKKGFWGSDTKHAPRRQSKKKDEDTSG